MTEVQRTAEFTEWLQAVQDSIARAAILARLDRLALGNPGDARSVGEGVSELRIEVGPGYRAYYMRIGAVTLLMLAGGDKSTQDRDIQRALQMSRELRAASKGAAKAKQARKPK